MLNRIKNKDNILLTLQMKNIRKATIAMVGIYRQNIVHIIIHIFLQITKI